MSSILKSQGASELKKKWVFCVDCRFPQPPTESCMVCGSQNLKPVKVVCFGNWKPGNST